jgi:hypothetical protein
MMNYVDFDYDNNDFVVADAVAVVVVVVLD